MSMWTNYTQSTPAGVAGGLYDLTDHVVDSRMNEAAGLKFGMGVVQGKTAGKTVKLPATGATIDKFEGIIMTDVRDGRTGRCFRSGKEHRQRDALRQNLGAHRRWRKTKIWRPCVSGNQRRWSWMLQNRSRQRKHFAA